MADREKVIKGLEHCISDEDCRGCPYFKEILDSKIKCRCCADALALLKEQEPKPVGKEWNECPSCGKALDRIRDMHYCGVCGQAVKWDE